MIRSAAEVLNDLEQACLVADRAISERRWDDCNDACILQRKLTHELEHAFRLLPPGKSKERDAALYRIARIMRFREGQLTRVRSFHERVGTRLANLARFRRFSRSVGGAPQAAALFDAKL